MLNSELPPNCYLKAITRHLGARPMVFLHRFHCSGIWYCRCDHVLCCCLSLFIRVGGVPFVKVRSPYRNEFGTGTKASFAFRATVLALFLLKCCGGCKKNSSLLSSVFPPDENSRRPGRWPRQSGRGTKITAKPAEDLLHTGSKKEAVCSEP